MKLLEAEVLPFDPSVTSSQRVWDCLVKTTRGEVKEGEKGEIPIKFSQYMEQLMSDSGIKPDEKGSWLELQEKDQATVDEVFQGLYKDWKETSNRYLKNRIKGQLVEWLIFKGLMEKYKNTDSNRFQISKSTDPYVDKELYTDLFIGVQINKKMRTFGLDITINNKHYLKKMEKYNQMVKDKGQAYAFNSIPILLDINNPRKPVYLDDNRLIKIIEDPKSRQQFGDIFYKYTFLEQINDYEKLPELGLKLGKRKIEELRKLPIAA